MRALTRNTSRNSWPFVFFVRAMRPDSNAPLAFTTPMRPPSTRMNTMMSAASTVPDTMLTVMSAMPLGCCSRRSYVLGTEMGLDSAPEVNWSIPMFTPIASSVSCVAGSSLTAPWGLVI